MENRIRFGIRFARWAAPAPVTVTLALLFCWEASQPSGQHIARRD